MAEDGWLVESVTTFLFTPSHLPMAAFRDLTGSEPARSATTQPTRGPFQGAWLWLAESTPAGRIQLAITPAPVEERDVAGVRQNHIGDLETRLRQIQELTLRVADKVGRASLWRLGLGVSLLHPVASIPAGYEWLTSHGRLPFKPDRDDLDLVYRINRQAAATGSMPPSHRLRTLTVESAPAPAGQSKAVCRLEIDISNVQAHPLNSQRHSYETILREFSAWAVTMAERGDYDDRSHSIRQS